MVDPEGLLEKLRPVVCFDPARPEQYRDPALLREILEDAIPSLLPLRLAKGAQASVPQGAVNGY
jgi:hypothetical protein